jgi:hypothetical protein
MAKALWQGNPSAGWIHDSADCDDGSRVLVQRLKQRLIGSGPDRQRSTDYTLTCASCGAHGAYTAVEPDPDYGEVPKPEQAVPTFPMMFKAARLRAVIQELEKIQDIVKPLGFLAGVHINVKGETLGTPRRGEADEEYRVFFDGMFWQIKSFSAMIPEQEQQIARRRQDDQENSSWWI